MAAFGKKQGSEPAIIDFSGQVAAGVPGEDVDHSGLGLTDPDHQGGNHEHDQHFLSSRLDRGPGRHGHQPGAWRPVCVEHLQGCDHRFDQGRRRRRLHLEPRFGQRSVCPGLPGLRLLDDHRRAHAGQDRPARHLHHRRPAGRRRLRRRLAEHQLLDVDPRLRRDVRPRHGLRLLGRHPAGAALVPAGQDRPDRRHRGLRFRPGPGLHRPALQLPARRLRDPAVDADPRHRLRHRRLPVRHAAAKPAGRLRGRPERQGRGQEIDGRGHDPLADPAHRQILHPVGLLLHRCRRRPDGDRQRHRSGQGQPRRPGRSWWSR